MERDPYATKQAKKKPNMPKQRALALVGALKKGIIVYRQLRLPGHVVCQPSCERDEHGVVANFE